MTVAITALVAVTVLAGCAGVFSTDVESDAATPESTATPTDTVQPTSAATATATATPTATPTPGPAERDTDGDGLTDLTEQEQYGTDPTDPDTDGDGLDDGAEVNEYGTDPSVADTDSDGLTDRAEVSEYGSDPTAVDTDGDGLDDGTEVNEYDTNPTAKDSDGDSLPDSEEIDLPTDPTVADTDDDGLNDSAEIRDYETDPIESDTDSDGFTDGEEVYNTTTYPDADPLHKDIYLEINVMRETDFHEDNLDEIAAEFADAPVSNPDDDDGITLHWEINTVPVDKSITFGTVVDYRDRHAIHDTDGYHYMLIGRSVDTSEVEGKGVPGISVVESSHREFERTAVMHELGHSLGLSPSDYRGIDSRELSFRKYPSVMNYEAPEGFAEYKQYRHSDDDFSDWEEIESSMASIVRDLKARG